MVLNTTGLIRVLAEVCLIQMLLVEPGSTLVMALRSARLLNGCLLVIFSINFFDQNFGQCKVKCLTNIDVLFNVIDLSILFNLIDLLYSSEDETYFVSLNLFSINP